MRAIVPPAGRARASTDTSPRPVRADVISTAGAAISKPPRQRLDRAPSAESIAPAGTYLPGGSCMRPASPCEKMARVSLTGHARRHVHVEQRRRLQRRSAISNSHGSAPVVRAVGLDVSMHRSEHRRGSRSWAAAARRPRAGRRPSVAQREAARSRQHRRGSGARRCRRGRPRRRRASACSRRAAGLRRL